MTTLRTIVPGFASTLLVVGGTTLAKDGLAAPLEIDVLDSTYTASLHTSGRGPNPPAHNLQRTQVSSTPIDDHIYQETPITGPDDILEAAAAARTFEVTASGRTVYQSASASAQTALTFSPLQDESACLTIDFGRFYDYGFTEGKISLFDTTTNQALFNYEWAMLGRHGNVPWQETGNTAEINFDEYFDNDHTYRLSMSAAISSNHDSELARISLSGLQVAAVPEPSTYALMLAGLGAAGFVARRRRSTRSE